MKEEQPPPGASRAASLADGKLTAGLDAEPSAAERLTKALDIACLYAGGMSFGEFNDGVVSFADIRDLIDENTRLRADAARLDFLDEANRRLNGRYGTHYGWRLIMNHNVNRLMIGNYDTLNLHDSEGGNAKLPSCRAAIDERMREVAAQRHAAVSKAEGRS